MVLSKTLACVGARYHKDTFTVSKWQAKLPSVNHTNIVLVPKVQSPCSSKQFRPISLCNVIYKIIAKVLANRLKGVLKEIIGQNQSAFVLGRLIFDNAMGLLRLFTR